MAVLLSIIGGVAFVLGAITIAFGFSIELSFGNSLIVAGSSAAVGGLIVFGLGIVVSRLQRIADALSLQTSGRSISTPEAFEGRGGVPGAGRVPFPTRPKSGVPRPPQPAVPPFASLVAAEKPADGQFAGAPTLPNPDVTPIETHEKVPLSPSQPVAPLAPVEGDETTRPTASNAPDGTSEYRAEPEQDHGWRLPPIPGRPRPETPTAMAEEPPAPPLSRQTMRFDRLWPTAKPKAPEDKTAETKTDEPAIPEPEVTASHGAKPVSHFEEEPRIETEAVPKPDLEAEVKAELAPEPKLELEPEPKTEPKTEPEVTFKAELETASEAKPAPAIGEVSAASAEPKQGEEAQPHNVPILKSGVVDGMGYTLYVDGSIEAELPQGTLRFSSINDLRNYLEQSGGA